MMVYADCLHFLPCILHDGVEIPNIRVLSNHVLFIKHILGYVIKIAISNPVLSFDASKILDKVSKNFKSYRIVWQKSQSDNDFDYTLLDHLSQLCQILSSAFKNQKCNSKSPLCHISLSFETVDSLINWVQARDEAYMLQLFIIPLFTQLACFRENWEVCSRLFKTLIEAANIECESILSKHLISTACNRTNTYKITLTLKASQNVGTDSILNQRMWAIYLLGTLAVDRNEVNTTS